MDQEFDWKLEYADVGMTEEELYDLYERIMDTAGVVSIGMDAGGPVVEVSPEMVKELERIAKLKGIDAQRVYEAAYFGWVSHQQKE